MAIENMSYNAIKTLLWLLLGCTLSYAGLTKMSGISACLIAGAVVGSALWLARHRTEVEHAYAARRSDGQQYIRESGQPWKKSPDARVIIALLLLVGAGCLFATFSHQGAPGSGYLRQVLYSLIGPQGTTVLAGIAAGYFLFSAAEYALGAFWSREAK
jgi:hypothetical protein